MTTIAHCLSRARARLAAISGSPAVDAEVLLTHVLGKRRSFVYAHAGETLDEQTLRRFDQLLKRRCAGVPVAYLLGRREFYGLELEVTPAVLVPRPETELLVDTALACLPPDQPCQAADLGTGSGAIALAIAAQRPHCQVYACDRSAAALAVARRNAQRLTIHNVVFLHGSWLQPLAGRQLPLIVSNPPYVAGDDQRLNSDSLQHEPLAALTPGGDGLAAIRHIIQQATKQLFNNGWLMLEHGYDQGGEIRRLMLRHGYRQVTTVNDLAGIERVTRGQWPGQR